LEDGSFKLKAAKTVNGVLQVFEVYSLVEHTTGQQKNVFLERYVFRSLNGRVAAFIIESTIII